MDNRRYVWWNRLVLALLVVYPFLWIWQGLDFTDTGFAMTNYQWFFHAPESIHYWGFNYWLTDAFGALWLHFFRELGLFGIRLLAALLMLSSSLVTWVTYRTIYPRTIILASLLVGETIIERMWWMNYDNFSALLFVVTGALLIYGLLRARASYLALAGFVLASAAFARVTNVCGLILILAILFFGLASKKRVRKLLADVSSFLAGFLVGVGFWLLALIVLHQWSPFMENLGTLFSIAGGHSNTHSSSLLLQEFSRDEGYALRILLYGLLFFIWITLIHWILKSRPFLQILLCSASFLGVVIWKHEFWSNRYDIVGGLTGILYGLLITAIVISWRRREFSQLAASSTALFVLFSVPLGSDLGILLAVYGMYLALPVATFVLTDVVPSLRLLVRVGWQKQRDGYITVIALSAVAVIGLMTSWQYTYRDTSLRTEMTVSLNSPQLRFVYTVPARAKVVNELLAALPRYVHPKQTILAYEETNLVYYLTDTIPYMDTSWPMLYDPNSFGDALQKAEATHKALPVVVRALGATSDFNWPDVNHLRLDYRHDEDRAIMAKFLHKYRYHVAWQNQFFQILVPPKEVA